ncbi:MAG: RHS repeat-associated core domain-containing protein [Casimicrobiaceae bacterium]
MGSWNYVYDAVGNRLLESGATSIGISPTHSLSFTYDVNDRLVSATGTKAATYEYDAAGNVTKKTETNVFGIPEETTYGWDAEGRMVSALPKLIITGGNTTEQPRAISYLYDPEGQLVREVRAATVGQDTPPANVTLYLADKNLPFSQILEERDGVGVLKAAYTFGDAPIKQVAGGVTSFFHGDHMSTKFIAAANGDVQARFSYSPYGETKDVSGGATSLPIATTVHQFAGERLNADTGLYYNRARWMDPGVGRFASIDPYQGNQRNPKELHDYSFASSDPGNHRDPSGLFVISDIGATLNINASNAARAVPTIEAGRTLGTAGMLVGYLGIAAIGIIAQSSTQNRSKKLPFIVFGDNVAGVRDHIQEALVTRHLPPALAKASDPHLRYWVGATVECTGRTGGCPVRASAELIRLANPRVSFR